MRVTQSIESNVNILAMKPTAEKISSILESMPFELYHCHSAIDAFMIPHFILFLDGNILTKDNKHLDAWECYLTDWSGRMKKCPRCRHYLECIPEEHSAEDGGDEEGSGPDFKAPIILLNANKRQREVEGLIALIPPMSSNEPFSSELEDWLRSTSIIWHQNALRWRKKFMQWQTIQMHHESLKSKTASEIAGERWMPRQIMFELRIPDYD